MRSFFRKLWVELNYYQAEEQIFRQLLAYAGDIDVLDRVGRSARRQVGGVPDLDTLLRHIDRLKISPNA